MTISLILPFIVWLLVSIGAAILLKIVWWKFVIGIILGIALLIIIFRGGWT